jgi:hypothetical protein
MSTTDILRALRRKDFHAANEGFAAVMQTKLADRLAEEKRVLANEWDAPIREEAMPVHEVQRVFDEIGGDVAETELLCGVTHIRINENGDVVSYVTEAHWHTTSDDRGNYVDPKAFSEGQKVALTGGYYPVYKTDALRVGVPVGTVGTVVRTKVDFGVEWVVVSFKGYYESAIVKPDDLRRAGLTEERAAKISWPGETERYLNMVGGLDKTPQEGNVWRVEVIADLSGKWCSNRKRYATKPEAEDAARNLASRWTAVTDWRVMRDINEAVTPTCSYCHCKASYALIQKKEGMNRKVCSFHRNHPGEATCPDCYDGPPDTGDEWSGGFAANH